MKLYLLPILKSEPLKWQPLDPEAVVATTAVSSGWAFSPLPRVMPLMGLLGSVPEFEQAQTWGDSCRAAQLGRWLGSDSRGCCHPHPPHWPDPSLHPLPPLEYLPPAIGAGAPASHPLGPKAQSNWHWPSTCASYSPCAINMLHGKPLLERRGLPPVW